ncbi:aminopeptidase P family protein [Candidatus Thorarchaeota archaeon]|nr:MAG: aminopeptidase P family protein [Candidatus Thorarchaeota archaeon]
MQFTPQRLEKLNRFMKHEEVDAIIVTRSQDVQYLTGYQNPRQDVPVGCLIPVDQSPSLLVSESQHDLVAQENLISRLVSYKDSSEQIWHPLHSHSFWEKIVDLVGEQSLSDGMIGLQHEWITVKEFDLLKEMLPRAGFKNFSNVLWRMREVKDAMEIDAIIQAVKIAEIGLRTALEVVAAGKTESETSVEIEAAMRSAGGQLRGIRAAVLSGLKAPYRFSQPTSARIDMDSPVLVDITVSHAGYFAEVARTLHTSRPTDKQKDIMKKNHAICDFLEKQMKPNVKISDLMEKVSDIINLEKTDYQLIGPVGNSIGLDLREPPLLISSNPTSLREGMIFSVHPTFYHEKSGSVKTADVFRITQDGCENLSRISRETM